MHNSFGGRGRGALGPFPFFLAVDNYASYCWAIENSSPDGPSAIKIKGTEIIHFQEPENASINFFLILQFSPI